jgi:diguanylate cyclase (GGDEF)-like protein
VTWHVHMILLSALRVLLLLLCVLSTAAANSVPASDPVSLVRQRFYNPSALAGSAIFAMAEDEQGILWLGDAEGLLRFDGHKRERVPMSGKDQSVQSLWFVSGKGLWIGHRDGLDFLPLGSDRASAHPCKGINGPTRILQAEAERVWVLSQGQIIGVSQSGSCEPLAIAAMPANAVVENALRHDTQWILALRDQGLWRLRSDGALQAFASALSQTRVRLLRSAPDGSLFAGTHRHGLFRLDTAGKLLDHWYRDAVEPSRNLAVNGSVALTEHRGHWILGSWAGGLTEFAADGAIRSRSRTLIHDPFAISGDSVNALLSSRSGALYVAHDQGLSVHTPVQNSGFWLGAEIGAQRGLLRKTVLSVQALDAHIAWIGGSRGGLYRVDTRTGELRGFHHDAQQVQSLPNDTVWDIQLTHASAPQWAKPHGLWLATSGGLARLNFADQQFTRTAHTPTLASDDVTALADDFAGGVWISMWAGGIAHLDASGKLMGHWRAKDGLQSENFDRGAVQTTRAGRVVVSNDLGVFQLNQQSFERVESLSPKAHVMTSAADSSMWLARERTLWHWPAGSAQPEQRQIPDLGIIRLLSTTPNEQLLLASDDALYLLDPALNVQRTWRVGEALLAQVSAMDASHAGVVWLASKEGVQRFELNAPLAPLVRPKPAIVGVRLFNESLRADPAAELRSSTRSGGPLLLRYEQDLITLDFAQPGLPPPPGLRFRYRLQGFDSRWIAVDGKEPRASYTRLSPGRYQFEVQARSDEQGQADWSEAALLPIRVLPPWWMTWWFRAALIALGVLSILAWLQWRTRSLRLQSQRLEQKVQARTQELNQALATIQQAAFRDPLTQLLNRRGLQAWRQEHAEHLANASLWLADIDHFKSVNDRFGHDVGDTVLKRIADCLTAHKGPDDALARWGGEEFICILRGANAFERAERMRTAVREVTPPLKELDRMSLSAGLAKMHDAESFDVAVKAADAALYLSKQGGRDRLTLAET